MTGAGRILIVDDSKTVRIKLKKATEALGYEATSVDSGPVALEQLAASSFDLVLLDIMMPGMDGFAVLQALKSARSTRDLPVIVISAHDEMASVIKAIELGAEDFLPKDFEIALLKARVSTCIEKKQREVNLAEKSAALEALSSKLAKYLAPQVYSSIFSGRQEVRIASQRKKLTICFSDIAAFTETTDKMESEELTQLLNHYLTEMSKIALEHGATIDKYVGDAILMFFGDPETRGFKEDALACVQMALAMQRRMTELASIWRDAGIETPLRCRVGIHTDYCTVGNFGSEDRMDYTIIGGAVNLASRLEHEAEPGTVLISYETFALVRDTIHCEEQGPIQVRGIAYPVAAYRAIDLKANLAQEAIVVRADLPHLKLTAEPQLMSAAERAETARVLRNLLDRLA